MHFFPQLEGKVNNLIFVCRLALHDLGRPHVAGWIIHRVHLVEGWSMA